MSLELAEPFIFCANATAPFYNFLIYFLRGYVGFDGMVVSDYTAILSHCGLCGLHNLCELQCKC